MRTRSHLAAGLACIAVAGCGSYTTYQTAEPLGPGHWQGAIALAPGAFHDTPSKLTTPTIASEVAIRRGVGGDTDLGFKIYGAGAEVSVRHRLYEGAWSWAVLVAAGGARTKAALGTADAMTSQLRATVVATRRTSERWAFSVGPVVTGSYFLPAGGGHASGLLVGGFANAEWSYGWHRRWHLVPELSIHHSVAGDVPVVGSVVLVGLAVSRDF